MRTRDAKATVATVSVQTTAASRRPDSAATDLVATNRWRAAMTTTLRVETDARPRTAHAPPARNAQTRRALRMTARLRWTAGPSRATALANEPSSLPHRLLSHTALDPMQQAAEPKIDKKNTTFHSTRSNQTHKQQRSRDLSHNKHTVCQPYGTFSNSHNAASYLIVCIVFIHTSKTYTSSLCGL